MHIDAANDIMNFVNYMLQTDSWYIRKSVDRNSQQPQSLSKQRYIVGDSQRTIDITESTASTNFMLHSGRL